MTKIKLLILIPLVSILLLGTAAVTADRWMFVLLNPGEFDASKTPPAPDFTKDEAWAALPTMKDGADEFIADLPSIEQEKAPVDVFYLHPTTAVLPQWNAPFDAPETIEATERGGTLIQASVFNSCCAVYAPRYRQANGKAFLTPDEEGQKALDIAYEDISEAFDEFLTRTQNRGFIIAGHSQGTFLAARLLRERIAQTQLKERFIGAYILGANIREEDLNGIPACSTEAQTGCVVAWNARGPKYKLNGLEYDAKDPDTMKGRICTNPLNWNDAEAHISKEQHQGALFLDNPEPEIIANFCDAQCKDGTLIISDIESFERDLPSKILLQMMGPQNYHPIEYQLFYLHLRTNAQKRVDRFLNSQPQE